MRSIHHRTIRALAVQQRLLSFDPLTVYISIDGGKSLMTHIHITEELIRDSAKGSFIDAVRAKIKGLIHDTATHSWVKP